MTSDPVESIARTTLYEGYVLWPYRRSALKNQRRWTFGGVYPRGFCELAAEGDAWRIRCDVLVEAADATALGVELRFLHAVHRQVLEIPADGDEPRPVDRLDADGRRHLTWDEATERRFRVPEADAGALLAAPRVEDVEVTAGTAREEIRDADGAVTGFLLRAWEPVEARIRLRAEPAGDGLLRLTTEVENRSGWRGSRRDEAQRRSLLSTHLVFHARGGDFCSLTDPPAAAAGAAAGCRNEGVWPVLVGDGSRRDTVLASPLILEDFPRVAPESPGDLFDGGEIDQLLLLNVLALSDEEKAEMAASDPRAREVLERTEGLSRDDRMRLHGTFRDPRTRRP
jgi:hypothetical protein